MKLNIPERILAMQIVADFKRKQSNFINFRAIKDLESKLPITEEEEKKYDLKIIQKENTSHYEWNPLGYTEEVEIEISDKQKQIIVSELILLNDNNLLTIDHMSLCEKLVPNPEEVFKPKETTESK